MPSRAFAAVASLLLIPAGTAPAAQKVATADWSRTVVATPEGGFRLGNPKARVKLVEYGSLTCSHCRHFAETGMGPLIKNYVRSGRVSYEYRNMILNGIDVSVSIVARCGGAARFFPVTEELYAKQDQWIGKVADLPKAEKDKLEALSESQRLQRIAEITGVLPIAARHGVPPAKAKACLANKAALDRLVKMRAQANALEVPGTPTFFINGKKADAGDWSSLEPLLKAAGG